MRNLTPDLLSHLQGAVTTLATCWRLTRTDGFTLGFTDHDCHLEIDDLIYDSIAGFTPTNVESNSDMAVDNLDLQGQLFQSKITETDLLAGKYDFAEVEIFQVNYNAPNSGKLIQKRGVLGEVTLQKNLFYAEVRGIAQFLSQTICNSYLPHCRANLGDNKCKFNLNQAGFTVGSLVTEIIDSQSFIASELHQPNDWFSGGYIWWQSGGNKDLKMEVKTFTNNQVTLVLPMGFEICKGDEFTIVAGCDKTSRTCIHKFGNIINFRGEPDLVGTDRLMSTAGTRR